MTPFVIQMMSKKSRSVTRPTTYGSLLENKRNVLQSVNLIPGVFYLLIFKMAYGIPGSLGEELQNMAVSEGKGMNLRCQANSERVTWSAKLGSSAVQIYDGYSLNPRVSGYDIRKIGSGNFELIFNASNQAAKLFICQEVGAKLLKQSAEVIVIESEPKCNQANSSESDVTFICQIGYYGNWRPKLEWRIDDEPVNSTDLPNSSNQLEGKVLSVAFDYFYKEDHTFTCHASFSLDMYNGEATVKKVPQYNSFCNVTVPQGILDTTNMTTNMPESESNHCRSLKFVIPIVFIGLAFVILLLFFTRKKWLPIIFPKQHSLNSDEEKKKINNVRNSDSTKNETENATA